MDAEQAEGVLRLGAQGSFGKNVIFCPDEKRWHEARHPTVGASELGGLLGLSKFPTQAQVYQRMRGLTAPGSVEVTDAMRWGSQAEAAIRGFADEALEPRGVQVWHQRWTVFRDPGHRMHATPDGVIVRRPGATAGGLPTPLVWEAKTARNGQHWGTPPTGPIPEGYWAQVQATMWCVGEAMGVEIPGAMVWATIAGAPPVGYEVSPDIATQKDLARFVDDWYERHIVRDEPLSDYGSEGYREYLKERFPSDTEDMLPSNAEFDVLARRWAVAKATFIEAEENKAAIEDAIKTGIGNHSGVLAPWGKFTWKKAKDTQKVNWKNAFGMLVLACNMPSEGVGKILEEATEVVPGSRRFLATVDFDEVEES